MGPARKVLVVFGTRPEAIKLAPVVHALGRDPAFEPVVCVTAQHREMLDQVLDHFSIVPHHDLDIMEPRQSLTRVTVKSLEGLETVLARERPAMVLVHGDAAAAFAGSLAAFYQKIPVGHVEAGLRTYRRYEPFPEEMYRRLADVVSELHFAPTPVARQNLLREGVPAAGIHVTGNTVIDALLATVRPGYRFSDPGVAGAVEAASAAGRRVILVECHRRENWGRPMDGIFSALRDLARRRRDVELLVSAHRNPEAGDVARRWLAGEPRVHLFGPLPYPEWANLMARARFMVTDSGGHQEEAPALGTPVLLCRAATERPEAIEAGTVRLVGTDGGRIIAACEELLDDPAAYERMARAKNPFGDGRAAGRIVQALRYAFGLRSRRPSDFRPGHDTAGRSRRAGTASSFPAAER